jgi:hypothetical protein
MPKFRSRPYRNGISPCLLFDDGMFFVPVYAIFLGSPCYRTFQAGLQSEFGLFLLLGEPKD